MLAFANRQVVFNTEAGVYMGTDQLSTCKCYVYAYTQISENATKNLCIFKFRITVDHT